MSDFRLSAVSSPSRREFVTAAAAATGVAALFPGLRSLAQTGPNPRRIDVHHHFVSPAYAAFTKAHNMSPGPSVGDRGRAGMPWDLTKDLDDMDHSGTAVAINSITTPGFWFATIEEVRKAMRECNEFAAKLGEEHGGRFGSFAAIHM